MKMARYFPAFTNNFAIPISKFNLLHKSRDKSNTSIPFATKKVTQVFFFWIFGDFTLNYSGGGPNNFLRLDIHLI